MNSFSARSLYALNVIALASVAFIPSAHAVTSYEDSGASQGAMPRPQKSSVPLWTVFREKDATQIWAVTTSSTKREVQTLAFFSGQSFSFEIRLVENGRLDAFAIAAPITSTDGLNPAEFRRLPPPPCRLLKAPEHAAVYLVCEQMRRPILHEQAFHKFGWDFKDVQTVPSTELEGLPTEAAVDEQTVLDEDVSIEAPAPATKSETQKRPMGAPNNNANKQQLPPPRMGMEQHGTSTRPTMPPPGECALLKAPNAPAVHLVCGNQRRPIINGRAFEQMGWKFRDVRTVPAEQVNTLTEGAPITEETVLEDAGVGVTPSLQTLTSMPYWA
jgi:hypothetical protein